MLRRKRRNSGRFRALGKLSAVLVAALLALLWIAATASAATLFLSGSAPSQTLTYVASSSGSNDLVVTRSGATFSFAETGNNDNITVLGIGGCSGSGTLTVSCPASGVGALSIDLRSGADVATVNASTPTTFVSSGGNDQLHGGTGADIFQEGSSSDGADDLYGGGGVDTVDYSARTSSVRVDLNTPGGDGQISGNENDDIAADVENIVGGSGDDILTGNAAANALTGGDGNDTLDGRGGNDSFAAGATPDGSDTIIGGDGSADLVNYVLRSNAVTVDLTSAGGDGEAAENDDVQGSVEWVVTGSGNDTVVGDDDNELVVTGDGNDVADGNGGNDLLLDGLFTVGTGANTFNGGAGDDLIIGGSGVDTIDGGAGDDDLNGGNGDDTVSGGDGSDVLRANAAKDGADVLNGGDGVAPSVRDGIDTVDYSQRTNDVLVDMKVIDGNEADGEDCPGASCEGDVVSHVDVENVLTGSGNDEVHGTPNGNVIRGGAGNDLLDGFEADDTLDGGSGDDLLIGGLGTDKVDYSSRTNPVGVDLQATGPSTGTGGESGEVDQLDGIEDATGGAADDVLRGADATINVLRGGPGDDVLDGRGRGDLLFGQAGAHDLVDYSGRAGDVIARPDGVAISGEAGEGDIIGTDVEDLSGGSGNDQLDGGSNDNKLTGGPGADRLFGRDGADELDGGSGADLLEGGADADALNGGQQDDRLRPGHGDDVVDGGSGSDLVDYSARTAPVSVNLAGTGGAAGESDSYVSVEDLIGGDGPDSLVGNDGDNVIAGGRGNDTLAGAGGNDVISGEDGNDAYAAGAVADGADYFSGGPGEDTASYAARSAGVAISADGGAGDGQAGEGDNVAGDVEALYGGSGNDLLVGTGAANTLGGGPGNDVIQGAAGSDFVDGGPGADVLDGQSGNDTVAGGGGNDSLQGGSDNDTLAGGPGDDFFDGGAGADLMMGGPGNDLASYARRTVPLAVSLDDVADDGQAGEADNVQSDVEQLITGAAPDTINTANGVGNSVSCGAGRDVVTGRDTGDAFDSSCEPAVCLVCLDLLISDKRVAVSRSGTARAILTCRARTTCRGKLRLTPVDAKSAAKKKRRKRSKKRGLKVRSLGSAGFSIASGKSARVKVKLPKRARKALSRLRKSRVKLTVTIDGTAGSTSRVVRLKIAKAKKKKKHKSKRSTR